MVKGVDGFLHERTEQLYVCDEYNLFLLTGQTNGGGRRAYIAAKAFHTIDDETQAEMRKIATPWTASESRVDISVSPGMLNFRDGLTGATSQVPLGELDDDVQQRLRGNASDPFQKYAGNRPPATKTSRDIAVSKPLTLKKVGLNP